MELDEQEVPATQAFEVFMGKVYSALRLLETMNLEIVVSIDNCG